jgi:ribonuclease H2 subunit A
VGSPEKYQAKLSDIFPTLKITVAKKADSLYPSVSAASICAKVTRDAILKQWIFAESFLNDQPNSKQFGSGYPGGKNK